MRKWLLVDDDGEDQDIFKIALADANPDVELLTAGNGFEALSLLTGMKPEDYPDIIFMDINMPRMDGKECLKEIKKQTALKNIVVIMYTTASEERDKKEFIRLGAMDFITKPSDIRDLIDILRKITASPRNSTQH